MELADKASFRDAMAHVGAAVNIITTDGPAGRAGFTASAVCSVTDTPPTLLVCLNRSASVWPVFSEHHTLCVNTLAAGQEALSTLFGGKTAMDERFAAADWQTGATGCPRLEAPRLSAAGGGAGQLRLPHRPARQRRDARHPVLSRRGHYPSPGAPGTDVV
ncbi:fMN reductase (NADH) RutF [Klebsiella variicola CAG:634]|nr:fMN reductase (NADH) RutF [Klebsiella variicola CAG:634]